MTENLENPNQLEITPATEFAGVPDGYDRLWTPHRMAYINGQEKPKSKDSKDCPFCLAPKTDDSTGLIVYRGENVFVLMNLFPYNSGHILICPYQHLSEYVDLDESVRAEFGEVTARAIRVMKKVLKPQGFNLGMNQGSVAGAGIAQHLHQHIVPRWGGDSNFFPIIAQTKSMSELLESTRSRLAAGWVENEK